MYLRPETAQGIFVTSEMFSGLHERKSFGIGQIGKAFRNEITPGNFIFRTREFEQMELEFFCKPGEDMEWFKYWKDFCKNWLLSLGMNENNIRMRDHSPEELSHYSTATTDIEYMFPFGWGEVWGIANRTDFDLKQHAEHSGENFNYLDPVTNEQYIPYCVEPSVGTDRILLAFLAMLTTKSSWTTGNQSGIKAASRPGTYKVAVLPLMKKLREPAEQLYTQLLKKFMVDYDETGSIGRRYRRQDEIGTPYCITIDFDTLEDNTVTVRDRDTMDQIRLKIDDIEDYLKKKHTFIGSKNSRDSGYFLFIAAL